MKNDITIQAMKPHDRLPDEDTLRGLEDWFKPVGNGSFFLDTQNILAADQVIVTGQTYLLFEYVLGKIVKALPVSLKRVLVLQDMVYVLLIDMLTDEVLSRSPVVGNSQSKRQWKLVDLDIINGNNLLQIEDLNNWNISNSDELLEFEL